MNLRDKDWLQPGFAETQKSSNITLGRSLSTSNRTYYWIKTSVFWYWPTPIYTPKMVGHLFSGWPNKVGKSVFRVMQGTTRISPISLNQGACFAHRSPKRCNTEPSRQRAMSFPMYFQCAIAKLMSVWWTVRPSSKKLTGNPSLYAPFA